METNQLSLTLWGVDRMFLTPKRPVYNYHRRIIILFIRGTEIRLDLDTVCITYHTSFNLRNTSSLQEIALYGSITQRFKHKGGVRERSSLGPRCTFWAGRSRLSKALPRVKASGGSLSLCVLPLSQLCATKVLVWDSVLIKKKKKRPPTVLLCWNIVPSEWKRCC